MKMRADRNAQIYLRTIVVAHTSRPTIYAVGDTYCVQPPSKYQTRCHAMLRREGDHQQGIVVRLPQETES
jgi:hypothetical protein